MMKCTLKEYHSCLELASPFGIINIMNDKNGKKIELVDYEAKKVVGIQIGGTGHRLWICIDGIAVLRIKSPSIILDDMRIQK